MRRSILRASRGRNSTTHFGRAEADLVELVGIPGVQIVNGLDLLDLLTGPYPDRPGPRSVAGRQWTFRSDGGIVEPPWSNALMSPSFARVRNAGAIIHRGRSRAAWNYGSRNISSPRCRRRGDLVGLAHGARCGRVGGQITRHADQNVPAGFRSPPLPVLAQSGIHDLERVEARVFGEHRVSPGLPSGRPGRSRPVRWRETRCDTSSTCWRTFIKSPSSASNAALSAGSCPVSGMRWAGMLREPIEIDAHGDVKKPRAAVPPTEPAATRGAGNWPPSAYCAPCPSR